MLIKESSLSTRESSLSTRESETSRKSYLVKLNYPALSTKSHFKSLPKHSPSLQLPLQSAVELSSSLDLSLKFSALGKS